MLLFIYVPPPARSDRAWPIQAAIVTGPCTAGQGPPQQLLPGLACTSEPIDVARMEAAAATVASTEALAAAAPVLSVSPEPG